MTYHTIPTSRLSGSILYTLISLASLTLITACGGGGLSLDVNLSTPESRLLARCAANPFTEECNNPNNTKKNAEIIADARDGFIADCVEDATSELCDIATTFVCTDETGDAANPFAPLCQTETNEATYELARTSTISTCIDPSGPGLTSQFCLNAIEVTCADDAERAANPDLCAGFATDQTVVDTCDANIFNSACDGNPTYIAQRNAFCATTSDSRCTAVISSTCTYDANDVNNTGNPFAALCGTTYEASRNTIITACTTDLSGRLCTNATTFACAANPFHALCYDASATVFQTARQTAVINCGDGTTTITEQICTDAVQQTCEGASADVFNALCIAYIGQSAQTTACGDNDDDTRCYLAEQINRCADGTETVRCAQVGTGDISTCAADPFAAACVATDSTFAPYLTAAQATRYAYCGADGVSAMDELCASYRPCKAALDGGETIPAGCGVNFSVELRDGCVVTNADFLFSTQCDGGQFDTQRNTFCGTNDVANLFHASCTAEYRDDTARNSFCTDNPFDANCNTNGAYAELRESNCAGAASARHASCVNTSLLVAAGHPTGPTVLATTPKYADSFMTTTIAQDNDIAPLLGPLFTAAVTKEVPGEGGAEPTTMTVPEISIPSVDIGPIVVGRRGGAGSETSRNNNPDGWAYFTLTRPRPSGDTDSLASTRTSRHVTILPTTNLGAPLTAAPATAVWPGHFSSTATLTQTAVDFYIDYGLRRVGFSSPTTVGVGHHIDEGKQRAENRPAIAIAEKIRIDVNWDAMGRLSGFIEINDDNEANRDALIVNGLIGQEGLVAVGYSNRNKGGAGGFTASNPDHPTYVPAFVASDVSDEETGVDSNANLVNYEDWLESGIAPSATPSNPRISELLQTATLTGNKRGFASFASANALIVDFSVADFRTILLNSNAKNGFAVLGQNGNFYAGVLHTADLGAPIIQTSGSAVWRGYLVAADGDAITRKAFDLDVTFSSNHDGQVGTLGGLVVNDINSVARSATLYTVDGRFNARGVISGDIIRSLEINTVQRTFTTPLSGLIGQTGAIAVFASNDAESKFAGGFVAVPNSARNVTHNGVWVATHEGGPLKVGGVYGLFDAPIRQNHWLKGGVAGSAGGVNGQSRAKITPNSLNNEGNAGIIRLSDATWNRQPLGGSAGNGVAFYSGVFRECTTTNGQETCVGSRQYYSGLFAQTDLGKPLTNTSGTFVWAGRLDVLQGNSTGQAIVNRHSGDIVLHVNFTNSGGTLTSVFAPSQITSPNYGYTINGAFNTDGFISGQVISRTGSYSSTGFLSGLIGQHGAVAAIVGGNMAGGFVAHAGVPPGFDVWNAEPPFSDGTTIPGFNTARQRIGNFQTAVSTYDDWAHYTGQRYGALRSVPHNESGQHNTFLHTDPADNHIPWGNIGQDGGREHTGRGAFGVGVALSNANLTAPAGLTGGFSWLAGFWDRDTGAAESLSSLNRGYHAGIFQDTNVGAVLGTTSKQSFSTTAYWSGWFYAHQNKTYADSQNTSARVTFLVNYGGSRRITTTYDRANGHAIGGIYSIQGLDRLGGLQWDERGVISGIITHKDANVPEGRITGLIGEQGMVAAFVSRADSGTKPHYGFTGGWVACPLTSRQGVCIP